MAVLYRRTRSAAQEFWEEWLNLKILAWEKDDCFDLPDPDSTYGRRLKAHTNRSEDQLIRRGPLPPRRGESVGSLEGAAKRLATDLKEIGQ